MSAALSAQERRGVAIRWLREHLFHSITDGAITVGVLAVAAFALYHGLRWVFVTAHWTVIHANLRLLLVGRFPVGEEWRIWVPVLTVAALSGLTWGALHGPSRFALAAMLAAGGGLLLLPGDQARP